MQSCTGQVALRLTLDQQSQIHVLVNRDVAAMPVTIRYRYTYRRYLKRSLQQ